VIVIHLYHISWKSIHLHKAATECTNLFMTPMCYTKANKSGSHSISDFVFRHQMS